jgi:peptidoglycan/xylan/chitin deacetylase (PgdA/CDA1 family)
MGTPGQGIRRAVAFALTLVVLASLQTRWAEPSAAVTACGSGHVALTFDDGPHSGYTAPILDVLAIKKVPATFFVLGVNVDARPALVRRQGDAGHVVANHTYQHERLTALSDAAIVRTVERTHTAITRAGAQAVRLVRPPYGATDSRVRAVLTQAGYGQVLWTVDPRDWERGATEIRSRVLANLHDGAIVLLHDGVANSRETLATLPSLIDGIRSRGYCFATLDARGRLVPPAPPAVPGPFDDVPSTSTHATSIARLKELGITQGCGDGLYCPGDPVTRAQMASFLVRAFELPAGSPDHFRDVTPGSTHATSIGAVYEAGITRGCSADGRDYCPSRSVTRAQMASFLARSLGLPDGPTDAFLDVAPGSTHAAAIGAIWEAGITKGCATDGRSPSYCPGDPVSRAQMASLLVRALEVVGRG